MMDTAATAGSGTIQRWQRGWACHITDAPSDALARDYGSAALTLPAD
jgi:hypothetical protein